MAAGLEQETETGALVLRSDSGLYRSGRCAGLYRHQSGKGALLDSGHQRIAGALPSGRNPDCGSGQEADAGPAELPPGMDCCGNHDNRHVRSRRLRCLLCRRGCRTKRVSGVLHARDCCVTQRKFLAASILRRPLTFQIPKQMPATSRPTNTQISGVDHFWSVPDHRRMAWRP